MEAKIQNIVSCIKLDQKIDLESLTDGINGMEYNPNKFPGVVYRLHKPRISFLIFCNGTMILTGAKSRSEINVAINEMMNKFKDADIEINSKPLVEIQNIVASANLGFQVNLDMLAMEYENVEYEPETFPGLIFRLAKPKTVMLIFRSGRIVITGAKTEKEVKLAAEKTREIVEEVGCVMK